MELIRIPTYDEENLIAFLINTSTISIPSNWKEGLLVCSMNDGEMGSLSLFPKGVAKEGRVFGKQISEFEFTDRDGVEVIASLNLDDNGNLFELDIWKTDFGKLIMLPKLSVPRDPK